VTKVKTEFNDLIKSLNPEYAKANAQFADAERIKNAFKMGEDYQKLDPKEAASKITLDSSFAPDHVQYDEFKDMSLYDMQRNAAA
jgi:uncharacterized protein (DUF2461 family)